jgi:hypothetical protein
MGRAGSTNGEPRSYHVIFDHEIGRPKVNGPLAVIVLKKIPPEVGVNSNFTELVSQVAYHQLVSAIEALQKTENVWSVQTCGQETKEGQPTIACGPDHDPCYRILRQVANKYGNLNRSHTKTHPEKDGRSPATFTAREARIFAADIWADPGTEEVAMTNSLKAMSEGLKYNIVPDFVYYVELDDILEGLHESEDHFRKKEDGPIRVHNSANLTEHAMSEYLADRTKILKNGYQWNKSELGF